MIGWLHRPPEPPEESIAMRAVVAGAVEVAIVAVVAQHAVKPAVAVVSIVLAPVGYWFSYRRRMRPSIVVKVLLAIGLMAALGQFLVAVGSVTSVDEARIPLASLFLWVQVLHAFDVPRRRDLSFSMVSSLILIAEAGALSLTSAFLWFLLPWAWLGGSWLYLTSRPRSDTLGVPTSIRRIQAGGRTHPRLAFARSALMPAIAVTAAAFLIFLATPRVPGALVKAPPFSLDRVSPVANFDGGVTNPALPQAGADGVVDFASGAYPGFSDVVDLRARGHLSDQIAFRVRAAQASLWRAEIFDVYDGSRWTIGSGQTRDLQPAESPGSFRVPRGSTDRPSAAVPTVPLTQTFYVDTPQPNVLFAAGTPTRVYFPASGLGVDPYGSIHTPILLDPGLVYSVVSQVPVFSPTLLRTAAQEEPSEAMAPYLQVPDSLPRRVHRLAAHITSGSSDEYGAVNAVQSWIRQHTTYNLDVPPDPPGVDEVDHFLFVTRQGFCEQIASSMAVMLRTLGIPTRLVTGFGPGTRNPFTGYFEVRQSDAHAWLEVYYPRIGWVPYDPTFGVPEASPGFGSHFMAGVVLGAIGRFVARVTPEPMKRAVGVALSTVAAAARWALRTWPVAVALVLAAAFAIAGRRRWRRRADVPPGPEGSFVLLTRALEPMGHPRPPHQTAGEYLRGVMGDRTLDPQIGRAAGVVVRTYERDRYSTHPPAPEEVEAARDALRDAVALADPRARSLAPR